MQRLFSTEYRSQSVCNKISVCTIHRYWIRCCCLLFAHVISSCLWKYISVWRATDHKWLPRFILKLFFLCFFCCCCLVIDSRIKSFKNHWKSFNVVSLPVAIHSVRSIAILLSSFHRWYRIELNSTFFFFFSVNIHIV